jgi:nitric oxide dioxygenase
MLDRALNMLGPDAELLAEILTDLGKKHARIGVETYMFPIMGEALVQTLRENLGSRCFTPDVGQAWNKVYEAMTVTMIDAMKTEKAVL